MNIVIVVGFQTLFTIPSFEGTFNNERKVEFVCGSNEKYASEVIKNIHLENDCDFELNIYYPYAGSMIDTNPILHMHGFGGQVESYGSWEIKEIKDSDLRESIDIEETLLVVIDRGGYMLVHPKNWWQLLVDNKRS